MYLLALSRETWLRFSYDYVTYVKNTSSSSILKYLTFSVSTLSFLLKSRQLPMTSIPNHRCKSRSGLVTYAILCDLRYASFPYHRENCSTSSIQIIRLQSRRFVYVFPRGPSKLSSLQNHAVNGIHEQQLILRCNSRYNVRFKYPQFSERRVTYKRRRQRVRQISI